MWCVYVCVGTYANIYTAIIQMFTRLAALGYTTFYAHEDIYFHWFITIKKTKIVYRDERQKLTLNRYMRGCVLSISEVKRLVVYST